MKIVGYYTEGLYEQEWNRLKGTLESLGLDYYFEKINFPDEGNTWGDITSFKPRFLYSLREEFEGDLLYVDVDCVVHDDPWKFLGKYPFEFGCGQFRDEILSGTLLIRDGKFAKSILGQLAVLSNKDEWDQKTLARLYRKYKSIAYSEKIGKLDPSLCYIFDLSKNEYPHTKPVIEHLQASREQWPGTKLHRKRLERILELDDTRNHTVL